MLTRINVGLPFVLCFADASSFDHLDQSPLTLLAAAAKSWEKEQTLTFTATGTVIPEKSCRFRKRHHFILKWFLWHRRYNRLLIGLIAQKDCNNAFLQEFDCSLNRKNLDLRSLEQIFAENVWGETKFYNAGYSIGLLIRVCMVWSQRLHSGREDGVRVVVGG